MPHYFQHVMLCHLASIEPEFFSPPPALIAPSLALAGLSFLRTPSSLTPIDRFSVSTIALTSSHVLLAGISLSQVIILLLWDLQFSVLLASHSLSIPSTLSFSLYIQPVLGPQTLKKTNWNNIEVAQDILLLIRVDVHPRTFRESTGGGEVGIFIIHFGTSLKRCNQQKRPGNSG
jgi:hypothetical protein